VEGEGMMHCWPIVSFMPEGQRAVKQMNEWLER
jgi:hypothetical protein